MSYPEIQRSLEDFGVSTEKKSTSSENQVETEKFTHQRVFGGHWCCPWCYARPRYFRVGLCGRTGCGKCNAIIPIEQEWYQLGEKVADPTIIGKMPAKRLDPDVVYP